MAFKSKERDDRSTMKKNEMILVAMTAVLLVVVGIDFWLSATGA